MCLPAIRAVVTSVTLALSGAAFADVTVSQSNNPNVALGDQMRFLLQGEKWALRETPPSTARPAKVARAQGAAPADTAAPPKIQPATLSYDPAWLARMPAASGGPEWRCLAEAVYFEARGEALRGQFAVAEVILNRVDSPRYPATVCGVVSEGNRNGCQFSFTCDGHPDVIRDQAAFEQTGKIAQLMLDGMPRHLTQGATHFHTHKVRPRWAAIFAHTARIGTHLFYRQPGARVGFGTVLDAGAEKPAKPQKG